MTTVGVNTDSKGLSSDKCANSLIASLSTFNTELHPSLMFNGTRVDGLKTLYDTDHNKADVAVVVEGSNLVNIEVNSSLMSDTVCKVIHGLIQLLRAAKAYCIDNENLQLQGFVVKV